MGLLKDCCRLNPSLNGWLYETLFSWVTSTKGSPDMPIVDFESYTTYIYTHYIYH